MMGCLHTMLLVQSSVSASLAGDWIDSYTEVFEPTGTNLTDSQVKANMMMMQESSEEVAKHSSVTSEMRDTVQFWYRAMTDTNEEHCNVGYLDDLVQRLTQISNPPTPNLRALFRIVFKNVRDSCSRAHFDIKDSLNQFFDTYDKRDLIEIRNRHFLYRTGQISDKKLSKQLFKKFGVYTTCSKEKIIEAWKSGPCGKLAATVDRLQTPAFNEFVKLVNYERVVTNEADNFDPVSWAQIIYSCKQLDQMIPDLAKNNNFATVTCRRISAAMDDLGYSYAVAHSWNEPPPPPSLTRA